MLELIKLCNINKYFGKGENRVHILKNISLEIKRGEFIAIIGQSGSGKSTLMNILGCLDKPTDGSYIINGRETIKLSKDERSQLRQKEFGFIFQKYNLISSLTSQENVALPSIYAGLTEEARNKRSKELLEKLELENKLKNKPNQLSGGQQQRVSIARALMNGGGIILADEPTGALDSKSGEMVMEIITNLHKEGHTIILVTHDKEIANYANRIIEIKDGEIYKDHTRKEMKLNESEKKNNKIFKNCKEISKFNFYKSQLSESLKLSLNAIITHKMRSLLTMLGIIIGIASIICVVALGNGSQKKILKDINSLGTNTIEIYNGDDRGDVDIGKKKNLTIEDMNYLKKQFYIESATPSIDSSGILSCGSTFVSANLKGIGNEYFKIEGLKINLGKEFSEENIKGNAQVVLIDQNTQKKFFKKDNPIGKIITYNKKPLKIIGTVKTDDRMGMDTNTLTLYSPYTTVMYKITGNIDIDSIILKIKKDVDMRVAEKSITNILKLRHGQKDFFVMNLDTLKKTIEKATNALKLLISAIAGISLVVGGIGVMNIMLVSVTERTREIGIRMAIGAKQRDILQQFLIESILLCFIGGGTGILISIGFGKLFNMLTDNFEMIFSYYSIIVSVLSSTVIGITFGYLPAKNASELDPIKALSRE